MAVPIPYKQKKKKYQFCSSASALYKYVTAAHTLTDQVSYIHLLRSPSNSLEICPYTDCIRIVILAAQKHWSFSLCVSVARWQSSFPNRQHGHSKVLVKFQSVQFELLDGGVGFTISSDVGIKKSCGRRRWFILCTEKESLTHHNKKKNHISFSLV